VGRTRSTCTASPRTICITRGRYKLLKALRRPSMSNPIDRIRALPNGGVVTDDGRRRRKTLSESPCCSCGSEPLRSAGRPSTSRCWRTRSCAAALAPRGDEFSTSSARRISSPDRIPTELGDHVGITGRAGRPARRGPRASSSRPWRSCSRSRGRTSLRPPSRRPAALLYGVKPVVIAVVVQALVGLTRAAVKSRVLGVAGLRRWPRPRRGSRAHRPVRCGSGVALLRWDDRPRARSAVALVPRAAGRCSHRNGAATARHSAWGHCFSFFFSRWARCCSERLRPLAFLRADLVTRWGWLTEGQLIDAARVGQVTPGPLFTTATFIGYLLGGLSGGLVATSESFCRRSCSWRERAARAAVATLAAGGRVPRRHQCGVTRPHGRGHLAARAGPRSSTSRRWRSR